MNISHEPSRERVTILVLGRPKDRWSEGAVRAKTKDRGLGSSHSCMRLNIVRPLRVGQLRHLRQFMTGIGKQCA